MNSEDAQARSDGPWCSEDSQEDSGGGSRTADDILEKLKQHSGGLLCEFWDYEDYPTENIWSIADVFLIQHLVHGCDGQGLSNVSEMYALLTRERATLEEHKMISEKAWNSRGEPLWSNYKFF